MFKSISLNKENSKNSMVFGREELIYQSVIDDFKNTKFIGIITFNISRNSDSQLLKSLKNACLNGTEAVIVTNIPKRFKSYHNNSYARSAKNMIDTYIKQLNPKDYNMRLNPYFDFRNHAKVILTDNFVYWGSSNFSDESKDNIEIGTISTDKSLIEKMKISLFQNLNNKKCIPYYEYNFSISIANLESLILDLKEAMQYLLDSSFIPKLFNGDCQNFEEKWVYNNSNSRLTKSFLNGFISLLTNKNSILIEIGSIIEKYSECNELPEQVNRLKVLYDGYNRKFDKFEKDITESFEELKVIAKFDVYEEALSKLTDKYGLESDEENLNRYADISTYEAKEEYEKLLEELEETTKNSVKQFCDIIKYLEELQDSLYNLLEINLKIIDNTAN